MSSPDLSEEEESPSSGKRPTIGRNEGVTIPTPPAVTTQVNPWQYLQSASNGTVDSPPNLSLKDYFEWTSRIRNLLFISEEYGSATVRTEERQFVCSGCLCPFPKIQGWFGPAASTSEDSSKASLDSRANHSAPSSKSNALPRGRGNRGRGRGLGKKGRGQY
ncbi:hypothetical protein DFJ58DRAFT_837652 [Suillus subalutaceus]|uniref:uncharacterized protein n=1 Tax=Suillus subalutaceus TaxID=48586 RepID=UPI001B882980|nr:uncharacterized protein DFJ58DRAFT_837652 [Suillus subalutaceus]KAG1869343.1 hypothetical protein DFJ58DRAFT_837652 [Suillus subalutaceus]